MDNGFAPVANYAYKLLETKVITHCEFLVLSLLFKWMNVPTKSLSYSYIAQGMALSDRQVKTSIASLVEKNLVKKFCHKDEFGRDLPNTYKINGTFKWVTEEREIVDENNQRFQGVNNVHPRVNSVHTIKTTSSSEEKNDEPKFVEVKFHAAGSPSSSLQTGDAGHISGPANGNTRASPKESILDETGPVQNEQRPSLQDITNTWQAENPDYAQSALKKIHIYADLFKTFRAHGYSSSEAKGFIPKLQKFLAADLKTKDWQRNVEKAIHTGWGAGYPVEMKKLSKAEEAERKKQAGTLESHLVPHEAKKFEKKKTNIVNLEFEDEDMG